MPHRTNKRLLLNRQLELFPVRRDRMDRIREYRRTGLQ